MAVTDEQKLELKAHIDELVALINSEEIAAGLDNLTDEAAEFVNGVLAGVGTMLKKLG